MPNNINIYFAGAIRAGRQKVDDYVKIVEFLKKYGTVLTEHVADPRLTKDGEDMDFEEIYNRDIAWLEECDIVVAEITIPSLGVGYEIAYAEKIGKKVICMYDKKENVSGFIRGNKNFEIISYEDINDLLRELTKILEK